MKMVIEPFNISNLVKDIFEQVEDRAEKKGTKLVLNANEKNIVVLGDPFRIKQVILNLVDNSIKYGTENGEVQVELERDKENVHISIIDDGPGIAHEHLSRIFDRFYRVEKSRSKEKGGSGLGLSIVQKVIESHQSKVSVISKIGKGTTFSFKLKSGNIG